MAHYFALTSKILCVANVITCKIVLSLAMTDENWRCHSHRFTLHFKAVVGIRPVNNPLSNIGLICMHACFLSAADRRVSLWSLRCATKVKWLLKNVWVWFNDHFLTIAHDVIRSKHVKFLSLLDNEHWTCDWASFVFCCCYHISFFNLFEFIVNIHDKCAFSHLITKHQAVSISDLTVSRVSPWHLFMILLIVIEGFVEW